MSQEASEKETLDHFNNMHWIVSNIENNLIKLDNLFAVKIFGSLEEYYAADRVSPLWMSQAGISSECSMSKFDFERISKNFEKPDLHIFNKALYFYDCINLISSMQNINLQTNYVYRKIGKILSKEIDCLSDEIGENYSGVRTTGGSDDVRELYVYVDSFFVSLCSCLDYITKIFLELENVHNEFSSYPRMKSLNLDYGNKKKVNFNASVFCDRNFSIKFSLNARNRIIHNGSIDDRLKLYQRYNNGNIIEQFILMPDHEGGNFLKYKSRSMFYNKESKLQDIVREIYSEIIMCINNDLEEFIKQEHF